MDIDQAAGVLVAYRRCTVDEAFEEIVNASQRHRVPTLRIARALVRLAEYAEDGEDPNATSAARYEWGSLMEPAVWPR
jgi:ANTAR domain